MLEQKTYSLRDEIGNTFMNIGEATSLPLHPPGKEGESSRLRHQMVQSSGSLPQSKQFEGESMCDPTSVLMGVT